MASKSKLLVRSHAIQESASPPPSPLKQEIKEQELEKGDESIVLAQKNNSDIHLTSTNVKKDEDSINNDNIRMELHKKNFGAIQKNVMIKETEKFEKPKIKTMGSSSSVEGASSGFISRGKVFCS